MTVLNFKLHLHLKNSGNLLRKSIRRGFLNDYLFSKTGHLLFAIALLFSGANGGVAQESSDQSRSQSAENAATEILSFENEQQRDIYQSLILELRCPQCQNQNIADSNAEIARDLRQKVYEMALQNNDKSEIKDFMLTRFGEFVLYKPQFTGKTLLLWILPIIILLIVIGLVIRLISRNAQLLATEQTEQDSEQPDQLPDTDTEQH